MCATSIGSTRSHSPVPGERKSGIPDGTEMPAPVRATTEPASRISSARRATSALRPAWDGAATCSAAFEARRAFAEERGDPLARVLGGERGRERSLLGGDAGVEVAVGRDGLDLADGERRLGGEPARPHQRGVEQFMVLDDAVDEPELERFLGEDRIADEVHLERLVRADEPRQPLRAAEP